MNNYVALGLFILLSYSSCINDPEEPVIPNEEETITTLIMTLTPSGGGDTKELKFQDLDGDGGQEPIFLSDTLNTNTTYSCVISLLNEQLTPTEDITEEVREEATDHQFFFSSTISDLTISYSDMDEDGLPIGILSNIETNEMGVGQLTITLRHEPNKVNQGVQEGNIDNAGGETDIEVTFDIYVQ